MGSRVQGSIQSSCQLVGWTSNRGQCGGHFPLSTPLCLVHLELVESIRAQLGIKMVPAARRRIEPKLIGSLGQLRDITPHLSAHVFFSTHISNIADGAFSIMDFHLRRVQATALLVLEICQVQQILPFACRLSCKP